MDLDSGRKILKSKCGPKQAFENLFKKQDAINIFTDGSKITYNNNETVVGFGIWLENILYNKAYKIPDFASIFTAESLALIHALDIIIQNNDTNFRIFSDSESALKSL